MADTDANKPKKAKDKAKPPEPKTVAEAKKLADADYWQLTDDEVLLRSPELEDEYKTSDSWRVFRIMGEFVGGFDSLATVTKGVSIFGSARTKKSDSNYKAARETAKLLAKAGFEIITGGGPGIMEAANRGAFEAGGLSIELHDQHVPEWGQCLRVEGNALFEIADGNTDVVDHGRPYTKADGVSSPGAVWTRPVGIGGDRGRSRLRPRGSLVLRLASQHRGDARARCGAPDLDQRREQDR